MPLLFTEKSFNTTYIIQCAGQVNLKMQTYAIYISKSNICILNFCVDQYCKSVTLIISKDYREIIGETICIYLQSNNIYEIMLQNGTPSFITASWKFDDKILMCKTHLKNAKFTRMKRKPIFCQTRKSTYKIKNISVQK